MTLLKPTLFPVAITSVKPLSANNKKLEQGKCCEAINLSKSHEFMKSNYVVSALPLLNFLISWQWFSALEVKVHPPPPASRLRPLSEMENYTPVNIICKETAAWSERTIASGMSHVHFLDIGEIKK